MLMSDDRPVATILVSIFRSERSEAGVSGLQLQGGEAYAQKPSCVTTAFMLWRTRVKAGQLRACFARH